MRLPFKRGEQLRFDGHGVSDLKLYVRRLRVVEVGKVVCISELANFLIGVCL